MKKNGFSILEVLICIAIIVTLGALIIPFFRDKTPGPDVTAEAKSFASDVLNINDPKVSCITKQDSDTFNNIYYCTVSGFDKTASGVKTIETLDCRDNGCSVKR